MQSAISYVCNVCLYHLINITSIDMVCSLFCEGSEISGFGRVLHRAVKVSEHPAMRGCPAGLFCRCSYH